MNLFKILFSILTIVTLGFSNNLVQKDLNDKSFSINKGSFKVVEFDKMVKNIKVSDEANIEIDFIENKDKPLQTIKVFAKEIGHGNILVSFVDSTSLHIDISIVENLIDIISVAKEISPTINIKQTNGKIILKGKIEDKKTKDKILDLFTKAGVDPTKDLVDLLTLNNPDKMIRLKLYAVEINNNKGLDLKNNWFVSSKNYMESKNADGTYHNYPINRFTDPDTSLSASATVNTDLNGNIISGSGTSTATIYDSYNNVNNDKYYNVNTQRNTLVSGAIDNIMANAVSLTGGLTGAANYLGKWFNAGLTLNYLSSKGVANILDETTLLTLENQDSNFHAGGTIYLKIATTTDQGVPSTQIKNINYGLQLDIKAENIVNDKFVNLNITTRSTQIDWANTVDNIPSFTEKSIKTNVVVGDKATIVLGGLISSSNSKDIDKIPLLGDIPILGFLFTSKAFKEGKSELVFFITPEIVDPNNNNQLDLFKEKTNFIQDLEINKKKQENIDKEENMKKEENTDELSEHQKRVKEILGY